MTKKTIMEEILDDVAEKLFGRKRTDSIATQKCVVCGGPATEFRDELSRREYQISGLCQKCQDEIWER